MGDMQDCFGKNILGKIICQKGERAERRAKELLGGQVIIVDSHAKIISDLSESLNTGKLGKLIQWLIKQ